MWAARWPRTRTLPLAYRAAAHRPSVAYDFVIALFVGLSLAGGFFQHAVNQHPQATVPSGHALPRYISVIVFEWLSGALCPHGCAQARCAFARYCWRTMGDAERGMKDMALGAGLWALWIGLMNPHILGRRNKCAQGLVPRGFLRAWHGYLLLSELDFVRKSHFAAIFKSNFRR